MKTGLGRGPGDGVTRRRLVALVVIGVLAVGLAYLVFDIVWDRGPRHNEETHIDLAADQ